MRLNPLTAIDFYKADHRRQYPEGTELVYSNFTPRSNKLSNLPNKNDKVVFFGLQYFIKYFLIDTWNENFFQQPKTVVVAEYKRRMDTSLGKDAIPVDHIEALHDLGYLPLEIRAVSEGTLVNMKVPCLTIHNTLPEFFWLVNYLESVLSCYLWKPCVSATTAYWYKELLLEYAEKTESPTEFVQFQGHDFSFRGMSGAHDAALCGAGHLLSFVGTDTVPAIDLLEQYYGANAEKELIGCSVPATEHSVMCMGGKEDELGTFQRLITQLYPQGIVSIVSDTWDFWKVVTEYVATLKADIMGRAGKVVIRPDSGDPVKIICGDETAPIGTPENKGAVQCLWEVFGGTTSPSDYRTLDSHIGLIYGDSITPVRATAILNGLAAKGFSSANIVFGIGSFTYTYCTRDTYGFAVKSTLGKVNGELREIYKDPVTDDGIKKSARGFIRVVDGVLHDQQEDVTGGDLIPVFRNGTLLVKTNLREIRSVLNSQTTKKV
jgi:nicotinamide phosphoribosyltransferase